MSTATMKLSPETRHAQAVDRLGELRQELELANAAVARAEGDRDRRLEEDVKGTRSFPEAERAKARASILALRETQEEAKRAVEMGEQHERQTWGEGRAEIAEQQRQQLIAIADEGRAAADAFLGHCRAAREQLRIAVGRFNQHRSRIGPFERSYRDGHPDAAPQSEWSAGGRYDLDVQALIREGTETISTGWNG